MTYTPEEREARNLAANARYRARHPERRRAIVAKSREKQREKHRDEINVRQLAKYHARKAVQPVTGTMGAIEAPDRMESVAPSLREKFVLALLTRDAKIWRQYRQASDHAMAPDDALSLQEAERVTPHTTRTAAPYVPSEAEKEKRRAAWTPERREAQRQLTAQDGNKGGDHGGNVGRQRAFLGKAEARAAAVAAGEAKFIREQPCLKCGAGIFFTSNGACVACARAQRNAQRAAKRAASPASTANNPSLPRLSQFTIPLGASQQSRRRTPRMASRAALR